MRLDQGRGGARGEGAGGRGQGGDGPGGRGQDGVGDEVGVWGTGDACRGVAAREARRKDATGACAHTLTLCVCERERDALCLSIASRLYIYVSVSVAFENGTERRRCV